MRILSNTLSLKQSGRILHIFFIFCGGFFLFCFFLQKVEEEDHVDYVPVSMREINKLKSSKVADLQRQSQSDLKNVLNTKTFTNYWYCKISLAC